MDRRNQFQDKHVRDDHSQPVILGAALSDTDDTHRSREHAVARDSQDVPITDDTDNAVRRMDPSDSPKTHRGRSESAPLLAAAPVWRVPRSRPIPIRCDVCSAQRAHPILSCRHPQASALSKAMRLTQQLMETLSQELPYELLTLYHRVYKYWQCFERAILVRRQDLIVFAQGLTAMNRLCFMMLAPPADKDNAKCESPSNDVFAFDASDSDVEDTSSTEGADKGRCGERGAT